MQETYDERECYCRSLGHYVRFGYCRTAGGELPCPRVAECWTGRFPVEEFLREHFTPQELDRAFAPRPGKLETILGIVQRLTGPEPSR
jgi:hypothetical protein